MIKLTTDLNNYYPREGKTAILSFPDMTRFSGDEVLYPFSKNTFYYNRAAENLTVYIS